MNGKKAEMPGTEAFKPDIRLIPEKEIENFFAERNKPRFHARQVIEWLWKKHCSSFAEMSNLSRQVREELEDHFSFPVIYADAVQKSKDGTLKTGFRLSDGNITEGVLIPSGSRNTVCISSQSGCPLACAFCATGRLGYFRNLTAGEIFDQVVYFTRIIQGKKESGSGIQYPASSIQHPASNCSNVV